MSKGIFGFGGKKSEDVESSASGEQQSLAGLGQDLFSGPGKEIVKSVLSDISSKNYADIVKKLPALIPLLGAEGKKVSKLLQDYHAGKLTEKEIAVQVQSILTTMKS